MRQEGFWYKGGKGYCESVPLVDIADQFGTPTYVYSQAVLQDRCHSLKAAFSSYPTLACYAVKANTNASIMKQVFEAGFGADIVSSGELHRALKAGARPEQIVYSGVGKSIQEIEHGLETGILCFNVESKQELALIQAVSERLQKNARVALRINPNINVDTNPYIATGLYSTKFGMSEPDASELAKYLADQPTLKLIGISCHLGSQIFDIAPYHEAAEHMSSIANKFVQMGHKLQFVDLGGGFAISYKDQNPPPFEQYAEAMIPFARRLGLKLVIEPGRTIVGPTGILLSQVLGRKSTPNKKFLIIDAAMNDLIRPCLYEAYHQILPANLTDKQTSRVDVVGPICETGDYLGLDRELPELELGELVYIRDAGAYGMSMSSNYNSRPRAAEVLVKGSHVEVIRRRETLEDLIALET